MPQPQFFPEPPQPTGPVPLRVRREVPNAEEEEGHKHDDAETPSDDLQADATFWHKHYYHHYPVVRYYYPTYYYPSYYHSYWW